MSKNKYEPKKLYLANNIEELNKKIDRGFDFKNRSIEGLIKSAEKLFISSEDAYREKDEEKAYLFCMRYFNLRRIITNNKDYAKSKKYYDAVLIPKRAKAIMDRATSLQSSLAQRYEQIYECDEKSKVDCWNAKSSVSIKNTEITSQHMTTHKDEEPLKNSRFIDCPRLKSLMTEQSSSYLIVDIRPADEVGQTQFKNSHVINIPESTSQLPGLTASKAGRELEERSRLLWEKRNLVDHLIICDEGTDTVGPLPHPIQNLIDAIEKWDPAKQYRTKPVVLNGGFYLFRLMYPMLATNPTHQPSKINSNSSLTNGVSLNFNYPDLNEGFCSTPSPPKNEDLIINNSQSGLSNTPNVNRSLKPRISSTIEDSSVSSTGQEDRSASDTLNNGLLITKSTAFSDNSSKMSTLDRTSLKLEYRNDLSLDSNSNSRSAKVDNSETLSNQPIIPSRSLKPKELLANFHAKQKELEETDSILDQSFKVEKDTLDKLDEIKENQKARESAENEAEKIRLTNVQEELKKDVRRLTDHSHQLESKYTLMAKENEDLWKLMKQVMANQMNRENVSSLSKAEDAEMKDDAEGLKFAQEIESSVKMKEKEIDRMRKLREEKAKAVARIEENQKRNQERLKSERESRSKQRYNQEEKTSMQKNRIGGDTYTTRLQTSPRSSPVRGGGKIRRSHSAVNISQMIDEESNGVKPMPAIDRKLKPLEAPKKRNFNASRQRNFGPRYGTVAPNRTGLKNLGNTCYMNSIIQCLSSTYELAQYFLQGEYSDHINLSSLQKGDVAEEVAAVIRALWCQTYRSIELRDLKSVVGRIHRPFQGYDQHDSHEFLLKLMDWLHNDLNLVTEKLPKMVEQNHEHLSDSEAARNVLHLVREREDSIVRNLFYGLHRSVIVCETCNHRSLTFEPFSVLSLSLPNNSRLSLKDMLYEYYKETRLEYKCGRCKRDRTCTRKFDIWKLPSVLVIHLCRFEHDILTKKKQNFVDFPIDNLDVSSYTSAVHSSKYDLYGVSNHYGTIDGGHYTAYCRSPVSKSWAKFDDHEVYDLSRESVKTSAAYILFYEASH